MLLLIIVFYDGKAKRIITFGQSRPNGINKYYTGEHAEISGLKYIIRNYNKNYIIVIWRFNRNKEYIPVYSCSCCSKTIYKYKFEKKIFTIEDNKLICGLKYIPILSKGMVIKYK